MLNQIVHRLLLQVHRLGGQRRTEICPPALLAVPAAGVGGRRAGLRGWLGSSWASPFVRPTRPAVADANAVDHRLDSVRAEFLQTIDDIRTQQSGMLQGRLRIARSLRELWHLRPEVYKLVALHFDQAEAERRLERLNRHFPTRSPRSGFAALDASPFAPRTIRRR